MNWNPGWGPPPPYGGGERIVYVPVPDGRNTDPHVHADPIATITHNREQWERLEKMFKKDDGKKDEKKKHFGLSESDIRWILILTAPFTGYIMCNIYINLFTHWPSFVTR